MFNSCGRQEDQDIFQIKRRYNTWLALCWHSPGRKQNTTMETTFQKTMQCTVESHWREDTHVELHYTVARTHMLIYTIR